MSFDLETILGLLFVIFFVIVPIFSKRRKAGPPGQPGQPGGPAAPHAPQAGGQPRSASQQGAPSASTSPTATASPRPQQAPAAGLQATLDEIRQRVHEAQLQERARAEGAGRTGSAGRAAADAAQASASAPSAGAKLGGKHSSRSADPFGSGMVSGQYSAHGPTTAATATGSQPASSGTPRHSAGSLMGREGRQVAGLIESAAPLEVTKTKRTRRRPSGQLPGSEATPARREPAAGAARLSSSYLGTTQADVVRGMIWHEVLAEPVAHRRLRRLRSRPR